MCAALAGLLVPTCSRCAFVTAHCSWFMAAIAKAKAEATRFICAFPEAETWNVTLLTEQQFHVVHEPRCSRNRLLKQLGSWLEIQNVHFFIRPLIANGVMLDLDAYEGNMESLFLLQPRVIASTSAKHYQMWLTIPESMANRTAVWVTEQLVDVLGSDPRSKGVTQQGRLPGSKNVKPGKGNVVDIAHCEQQDLDEAFFVSLLGRTQIVLKRGELVVQTTKPKNTTWVDDSGLDWTMACEFFEHNLAVTKADALSELTGKWLASRPTQWSLLLGWRDLIGSLKWIQKQHQ